jgi:hypothetical protein
LRFGIELEFEQMYDDYPVLDYWSCERDTSLRDGGVEYISEPLPYAEVAEALDEAMLSAEEYGLNASWRCGGHVHVNASYWTWEQLLNFAVLSTLVEPYLFKYFADGREKNHFCVPTWANTALIDGIAQDAVKLRAGRGGMPQILECSKYSAINYKPLGLLGTVEFRHLPATMDAAFVQHWIESLYSIVNAAHAYKLPENIIADYEDNGINRLLESLGLHTCEVDPLDAEDAYIAATTMCGYDPVKWQDLSWRLQDNPTFAGV